MGEEDIPWLTTDFVLAQFGSHTDVARKNYANFMLDTVDEQVRSEFHRGGDDARLLGDGHFLQEVMAQAGAGLVNRVSLDELLEAVAMEFKVELVDLYSASRKRNLTEVRGVAAWMVSELGQHTLSELAKRMGRDLSTLSLMVKKIRERVATDHHFMQRINVLRTKITQ